MLRKNVVRVGIAMMAVGALMSPAFGIAGIGIHYGFDMSLGMDDVHGEKAGLGDLKLDVSKFGGTVPSGYTKTVLTGNDLPITIDRTGWERHPFNMGLKIYTDVIPFIDALELSANYGMWQYRGSIAYPKSIQFNKPTGTNASDINDIAQVDYDTTLITLGALGLPNPFLNNTPYAKLQFDLTLRKFIFQTPPMIKSFKCYAGAGASLFYATPILSGSYIEKTLGTTLSAVNDISQLQSAIFGQNSDAMKTLGNQFMKDMMTPHWGAHLDVGAQFKIPMIPVGFYVDGKYLLPFEKLDSSLTTSSGILLNAGILFAI
jgi:hypothetical protein